MEFGNTFENIGFWLSLITVFNAAILIVPGLIWLMVPRRARRSVTVERSRAKDFREAA